MSFEEYLTSCLRILILVVFFAMLYKFVAMGFCFDFNFSPCHNF